MAKKVYFSTCPRCGTKAFEHLTNFAHCVECLYFEDGYEDTETSYHRAAKIAQENQINEEDVSQAEQAHELAS